ncbi:hypothetical protein A4A49_17240 [Nicotiana attenuata]|uniref:Uncharacterized protein n=1 Tax=Nicotiana attenuata TaxID=49451 RepID=A0A1J6I4J5_NICAT|nr:hypothetical protein A4A49_17240 [Nicotiana attenuata]
MPQAPPRRDNLLPPPPIPPQESRMINNPLFEHVHETTLNELDNIQQVFNDDYRGILKMSHQMKVQSSLKSLEEDQSTFSRGLMELNEKVQGKENTLDELQGKIAYPSTLASLVDCGDTLSLKDSYDIDEFGISLSCDDKNNCGLQLAKSCRALLGDSSYLFSDSLASDDVESYDSPPLWDDECDDYFDSTLTLLEESFELYDEMSQKEYADDSLDSIFIPLAKKFILW